MNNDSRDIEAARMAGIHTNSDGTASARAAVAAVVTMVVAGCSGKGWSIDDPWGVHQAAMMVDRANRQQAKAEQEKLDREFHESLCSTPEGRKVVEDQIARSAPGEVQPCPEDEPE